MRNLVTSPEELGITIPDYQELPPSVPLRTHLRVGRQLHLSGHIPDRPGLEPLRGAVGIDLSVEEGAAAAREAALNIVATLRAAVGDLDRIERIVRLVGYVRSESSFTDQPRVVNGASEVFLSLWGPDRGRPVRAALGVASLPFGVPVELELTALIEEGS